MQDIYDNTGGKHMGGMGSIMWVGSGLAAQATQTYEEVQGIFIRKLRKKKTKSEKNWLKNRKNFYTV